MTKSFDSPEEVLDRLVAWSRAQPHADTDHHYWLGELATAYGVQEMEGGRGTGKTKRMLEQVIASKGSPVLVMVHNTHMIAYVARFLRDLDPTLTIVARGILQREDTRRIKVVMYQEYEYRRLKALPYYRVFVDHSVYE